ncbi:hypothetical protein EDC22_10515 [Tepidamorphus gemmatus]|uniref:Uncharacterized protein n=1 Tax=Tepidamorphus gemmatus TaxID=747076 RepID=A0A4V2UZA0_9HYPH|nr:hypothetical protein [Tepidamorphus gemmatus]TCT10518.1 hypothetical protein EDC22_10515 [Tepidamorphus gemmatus]
MPLDMNDAEPQRASELIPDGTFAKVAMTIRPGGIDGPDEIDRGLLKASTSSDVLLLDCEFTVVEGPHARRKFRQMFTVQGGKVDEQGVSMGWKISKSTFRAMIDSALGLDPNDMSEAAKSKRILRGLADLNGIVFVAKIRVEPSDNPAYRDQNRLDRVVLPNEKEWKAVMEGREVPPSPSRRAVPATAQPSAQPAWNRPATAQPPAPSVTPAWATAARETQPQPQQPAKSAGPAWLNG